MSPGARIREVAWVLGKLGVIGFGGPAAHIALMREEMVVRRQWLAEREFLDLIGAASVLPGPTSTQVAILLGRRRAGWWGLAVGGVCFIAPAMLIVGVLAWAYVRWGTTDAGAGVLYGITPVVVAVIVHALWGLSRTAVHRRPLLALVFAGAVVAYLAGTDVLVVLVAAGVIVAAATNWRTPPPAMPLVALAAAHQADQHPTLAAILAEFLRLGTVVFGSGYVLVAFLQRDLVDDRGWLTAQELLDAVAVGQLTPGPVFTTATFVGYLVRGVPGALVATLGIFAPSFVLMAGLAEIVPRLRSSPWAAAALDGVNAAAIGVMAGVAVDLADTAVVDVLTALVAVVALGVLLRWRPNVVWLLAAGAVVGLLHAAA